MSPKAMLSRLVYVIGVFVFLECIFRVAFSFAPVVNNIRAHCDASFRLRWIERHQSDVEIYCTFDIYDSTKGWISKPNLESVKVFNGKYLNTNMKGFRGTSDYPYNKNPDKIRIILLGDSFTFGDEVSDNETFAHYLQEFMPDAEIINIGIHGYGHDQMFLLLKEEGVKYKPDIVILGFVYQNVFRNCLTFKDFAKPKFVLDNGKLNVTNLPIPTPEVVLAKEWKRSKLLDVYSMFHHFYNVSSGIHEDRAKELTTHILDEIISLVDSIEAIPVFIYLPTKNEIYNKEKTLEGEKFFYDYCRQNGEVIYFSSRPNFANFIEKHQSTQLILSGGHWSPQGHRIVAETINTYLRNHLAQLFTK